MTRRDFLKESSSVGALTLMPFSGSPASAGMSAFQNFLSDNDLIKTEYDFNTIET